jgi:DNA topoisomerase-1
MESAVLDQVAVDIASADGKAVLRATGSVVMFDGFLRVYQEERDDSVDEKTAAEEDAEARLPPVKEGDPMNRDAIDAEQHFTQPPPRYTEASLVKKLEELGIGRPSTYASIMQVLQDRDYVELDKRRFVPHDRGRLVTAFLSSFFERYVEYNFTADLEAKLDDVSGGRLDWKTVLRDFWKAFSTAVEGTKDLTITQVIDELDKELGPHFFPNDTRDGHDPRVCPSCSVGRLGLKLSRTGAFIGCSNYPECRYTRSLAVATGSEEADALADGPRELGDDPETGLPVSVRRGPYGAYVQLGPAREAAPPVEIAPPEPEPEAKKGKGKAKAKAKPKDAPKPKRVSLPKGMPPAEIDLETALNLLNLPRDVGPHPETGEMISAGIGRFGPYLKLGSTYKSLPADDDVLTIGLNRAVVLLAEAKKGPAQVPGRVIGDHPRDSKPVSLNNGRFGPYVKHGKVMASLPKAMAANADELTLEQAVELLDAKIAKDSGKVPAAKTAAKGKAAKPEATSEDAVAEPKAAKKPAAEKKAAAPKKAAAKTTANKATATKTTEAASPKPKARAAG